MAGPKHPGNAEAAAKVREEQQKTLAAQAEADYGAATSSGNAKNPFVYMGSTPTQNVFSTKQGFLTGEMGSGIQSPLASGVVAPYGSGRADKMLTLSDAQQEYYSWDNAQKNKFITQLNLAGFNASGMSDSQLASAWADYAGQAAKYYNNGQGQKLTPWDVLAKDMAQRESALNAPRTTTSTSTSSNLSTAEDAHAIFYQAAQSLLGRDPTKTEISSFQKKLNSYENANPTVTTTTSNYVGQDLKSQSSTTKGGVSADTRNMMAMENAKSEPEFGAYQAATTYMDQLMKTISGG